MHGFPEWFVIAMTILLHPAFWWALGLFLAALVAYALYRVRKPQEVVYLYGRAGPDMRPARRHPSGKVEFVLWRAGEQGHKDDYWIAFDTYWWPTFKEE